MSDVHIKRLLDELKNLVEVGSIGSEITRLVLPNGVPFGFETELFDYKEILPTLNDRPSTDERKEYAASIDGIIKDIIAFHNSYGGYILFGVKDKGPDNKKIVGCDTPLDCDDLNRKILGATDCAIGCYYSISEVDTCNGRKNIGVLLIPRRGTGNSPVRFKRAGKKNKSGKPAFSKTVYGRFGEECRPAADKSSDWKFLHSDRSPQGVLNNSKVDLPSNLPARDPDLVSFVGRENVLLKLREWIMDARSPVRMLSGIGGLGKTTIAYKFAEDVIVTGAGELEQVIWLTAKPKTFSAIQGKLVPLPTVGFTDLDSLLKKLIVETAGTGSLDEDMETDDLIEVLIDALAYTPALIIVDDLDSLDPDQQREAASRLQQISIRTVSRDFSPTRILMTSRLDQGLPSTGVINIEGLENEAFLLFVRNICKTFGIENVTGRAAKQIWTTTAGSPLFASSLLRLVKQGEDLSQVCKTWRDRDSEDVRKFAFERELKRLHTAAALTLLAVIHMGEARIQDLEYVLETTNTKVRDNISELQSFHLIVTGRKSDDSTIISASRDLINVKRILQNHLGSNAHPVLRRCASLQSTTEGNTRKIGIRIREIISYWDACEFDKAVISATRLSNENPRDADAASILGAAYLKLAPANFFEAEKALIRAHSLKCTRKELWSNLIRAKHGIEDWQGLREVTKKLKSQNAHHDEALDAHCVALQELIKIAKNRGEYGRIDKLAIEGIERISNKLHMQKLSNEYFNSLIKTQMGFVDVYVQSLKRIYPSAGDKLDIFSSVARLSPYKVLKISHIRLLGASLLEWWSDVENRPIIDMQACDLLKIQLEKFDKIKYGLKETNTDTSAIEMYIENTCRDLAHKAALLQKNN